MQQSLSDGCVQSPDAMTEEERKVMSLTERRLFVAVVLSAGYAASLGLLFHELDGAYCDSEYIDCDSQLGPALISVGIGAALLTTLATRTRWGVVASRIGAAIIAGSWLLFGAIL